MGKKCDNTRDDLVDNIVEYAQTSPLVPISKGLEGSPPSSEDDEQAYVTKLSWMLPSQPESDATRTYYNCWLWALNPLTSKFELTDTEGFPKMGTNVSVSELAEIVKRKIIAKHTCKSCTIHSESELLSEILPNLGKYEPCYIIAMRVSGADSGDYHFARYLYGQWSHKVGWEGRVQVSIKTTNGLPPEGFWEHRTVDRENRNAGAGPIKNPNRIVIPRDATTTKLLHIVKYPSPSMYVLVQLQTEPSPI